MELVTTANEHDLFAADVAGEHFAGAEIGDRDTCTQISIRHVTLDCQPR
jgi:hypothetical protein